MPGHRPVLDFGWALADVDHVADAAPGVPRDAVCGLRRRAPRCAGRLCSSRAQVPFTLQGKSTGRWSRETPASPHRREKSIANRCAICSGLCSSSSRACTSSCSFSLTASLPGFQAGAPADRSMPAAPSTRNSAPLALRPLCRAPERFLAPIPRLAVRGGPRLCRPFVIDFSRFDRAGRPDPAADRSTAATHRYAHRSRSQCARASTSVGRGPDVVGSISRGFTPPASRKPAKSSASRHADRYTGLRSSTAITDMTPETPEQQMPTVENGTAALLDQNRLLLHPPPELKAVGRA